MEMDIKRAKAISFGMAVCFLLIHLLMITIFYKCKVEPMVKVNMFSIGFYIFILWVIHRGWLNFYAIAVYLEVAIHMTLAVAFTGWDSGFQITLIGMNVLAFYAEYVARTLKFHYVSMMPFGILGMLLYVGSYVYIHFHPVAYMLPERAEFWLSILWGVIVFVINLFVLQVFVLIVHFSETKLEHQMSHDKLTGLPNRYYISGRLKELQTKNALKEYWIAIADIDNFKKINDTYGHNCGDYVLKKVAELTKNTEDILSCRWGGEEFIFLGKLDGGEQQAVGFLDGLRKKIATFPFRYEETMFPVTMTFGFALYSEGKEVDAWISEADGRLYQGKQSGKNRVVWED